MEYLLERIFTEAGLLAAISLAVNIVLWRNLGKEREKRERLEEEFRRYVGRCNIVAPKEERGL